MKKQPYLRFARLLFGSAFIVFFLSGPLQGEIIDKVVGIVNKDVIEKLKAGYVEEVRYVSSEIHNFVEQLEDGGVLDDSLIIVTSDHGQLLGEHNVILHGIHLHNELLRVPLIIHYPKSINFQVTKTKDVISTTRIYNLITHVIGRNIYNDEALYSDVVFSESWGLHHDIDALIKTRRIDSSIASLLKRYKYRKINNLERHRIRATASDFNYIYNADEQKIEYIKGSINEDVARRIIQKFIRDSTRVYLKMRLNTSKIRRRGH